MLVCLHSTMSICITNFISTMKEKLTEKLAKMQQTIKLSIESIETDHFYAGDVWINDLIKEAKEIQEDLKTLRS